MTDGGRSSRLTMVAVIDMVSGVAQKANLKQSKLGVIMYTQKYVPR